MTEPQLSAEMEKEFSKIMLEWIESQWKIEQAHQNGEPYTRMKFEAYANEVENKLKHFLATALEEQKQKVLDEVDEQLRQFQLIYGSFNSSTGDLMGYRISEHEESADVLIRYLRIKLNQLKGSDDQPVRNA